MLDTALVLAVCAAIAAFGKLVDQILLTRHVRYLDELALRYWDFLDDLDLSKIPRKAIHFFLGFTRRVFGAKFGPQYVVRVLLLSCFMTLLAVPGGRFIGLLASTYCSYWTGLVHDVLPIEVALRVVWENRYQFNLPALVVVNIFFDLSTIFATTWLLSRNLNITRHAIPGIIVLDMLLCLIFLIGVMYFSENFDTMSTIFPDGFPSIGHNIRLLSNFECTHFPAYTSRLLFSSTVIIPTFFYLSMMLVLLLALEGFRLSRAVGLYVLEKSVEDEKRSLVGHISAAIALALAAEELISVAWSIV